MKRILLSLLSLLAALTVCAQTVPALEQLQADPMKAYGNDYPYLFAPTPQTPAPRGYKPFYISHYARHGSRYYWNETLYKRLDTLMTRAHEGRRLTEAGERFYGRFLEAKEELMTGISELTQLGWDQHQKIARTMYNRFPEVFSRGGNILAISSLSGRCVLSMSAFCQELVQCNPKLEIREQSSRFTLDGVVPNDDENPRKREFPKVQPRYEQNRDRFRSNEAALRDSVIRRVFRHPEGLPDERRVADDLINLYTSLPNIGHEGMLGGIISDREIVDRWEASNLGAYSWVFSGQYGMIPILEDILRKADAVLDGSSDRLADLRFGHDSCIGPLTVLMGLNGADRDPEDPYAVKECYQNWQTCKASNIQLVFYRSGNASDDILVKCLLNGSEATLPVETDRFPYYRWEDLRRFYQEKCASVAPLSAKADDARQPDLSKYVNSYARPLRAVLADVEKQFGVRINAGSVPAELMVDFADFRIRPWDLEQTLEALLWPFGYNAEWNNGNGEPYYGVSRIRHSRRSPDEGQALLDYLSSKYDGQASWEARKAVLQADIRHSVGLDKVPEHFEGKVFLSRKRNHGRYQVQDLALEILPGLYAFGAVYWPAKTSRGAHPLVINPHGHSDAGHGSEVVQRRCAMQASMGCIAVSFSMFCNGPSPQFDPAYHHTGLAQPYNILCAERLLDYALKFKEVDPTRVGITGCSGGGSQSMFVTAIDDRITLSIPVVMMSSYFAGGCECESGTLLPLSGGGTSNPEIAAMCAPRPMLLVSDGGDWTALNPEIEVPYVQRIYGFYGAENQLESVHFPQGRHNYDFDKREAAYSFLARQWGLDTTGLVGPDGRFDESGTVVEPLADMDIWKARGVTKPADIITDIDGAVAVMHWVKDAN